MVDVLRRLVSGNKARIKDEELNLELDLVYLTDQIVIMGYPAVGVEALYRNRREDAKRFLDHRHGKNYWVFNFCPLRENSYEDSVFEGRVSRYPFPDHHVPPRVYMPLVSREIHSWLSPSPQRVAVLHCKAGKGRSGTMACSYLLSQQYENDHALRRCQSEECRAKDKADQTLATVSDDLDSSDSDFPDRPALVPKTEPYRESLRAVLELHTSRRMKPSSPNGGAIKQGVSIPSQRRWLHYWALSLSSNAPEIMWPLRPVAKSTACVKIDWIVVRMKYNGGFGSSLRKGLIKAAAMVVDNRRSPSPHARDGRIWASLARYDDELVNILEDLERRTRDSDMNMGISQTSVACVRKEFGPDGKWDKEKMIRCFGRLGAEEVTIEKMGQDQVVTCHRLYPLGDTGWREAEKDLPQGDDDDDDGSDGYVAGSMASTYSEITEEAEGHVSDEFILDVSREVRVKLHMGLVFIGWFWFIPSFHLPPSSPINSTCTFTLNRKELDFPVGIGGDIVEVELSMSWLGDLSGRVLGATS